MSEYKDIHNNTYPIYERTLCSETEKDEKMDEVVDDLFTIFTKQKIKMSKSSVA